MPSLYYLGFALLIWVACDLARGKVYLWNEYSRQEQPLAYWFTLSLWTLIALTCFMV